MFSAKPSRIFSVVLAAILGVEPLAGQNVSSRLTFLDSLPKRNQALVSTQALMLSPRFILRAPHHPFALQLLRRYGHASTLRSTVGIATASGMFVILWRAGLHGLSPLIWAPVIGAILSDDAPGDNTDISRESTPFIVPAKIANEIWHRKLHLDRGFLPPNTWGYFYNDLPTSRDNLPPGRITKMLIFAGALLGQNTDKFLGLIPIDGGTTFFGLQTFLSRDLFPAGGGVTWIDAALAEKQAEQLKLYGDAGIYKRLDKAHRDVETADKNTNFDSQGDHDLNAIRQELRSMVRSFISGSSATIKKYKELHSEDADAIDHVITTIESLEKRRFALIKVQIDLEESWRNRPATLADLESLEQVILQSPVGLLSKTLSRLKNFRLLFEFFPDAAGEAMKLQVSFLHHQIWSDLVELLSEHHHNLPLLQSPDFPAFVTYVRLRALSELFLSADWDSLTRRTKIINLASFAFSFKGLLLTMAADEQLTRYLSVVHAWDQPLPLLTFKQNATEQSLEEKLAPMDLTTNLTSVLGFIRFDSSEAVQWEPYEHPLGLGTVERFDDTLAVPKDGKKRILVLSSQTGEGVTMHALQLFLDAAERTHDWPNPISSFIFWGPDGPQAVELKDLHPETLKVLRTGILVDVIHARHEAHAMANAITRLTDQVYSVAAEQMRAGKLSTEVAPQRESALAEISVLTILEEVLGSGLFGDDWRMISTAMNLILNTVPKESSAINKTYTAHDHRWNVELHVLQQVLEEFISTTTLGDERVFSVLPVEGEPTQVHGWNEIAPLHAQQSRALHGWTEASGQLLPKITDVIRALQRLKKAKELPKLVSTADSLFEKLHEEIQTALSLLQPQDRSFLEARLLTEAHGLRHAWDEALTLKLQELGLSKEALSNSNEPTHPMQALQQNQRSLAAFLAQQRPSVQQLTVTEETFWKILEQSNIRKIRERLIAWDKLRINKGFGIEDEVPGTESPSEIYQQLVDHIVDQQLALLSDVSLLPEETMALRALLNRPWIDRSDRYTNAIRDGVAKIRQEAVLRANRMPVRHSGIEAATAALRQLSSITRFSPTAERLRQQRELESSRRSVYLPVRHSRAMETETPLWRFMFLALWMPIAAVPAQFARLLSPYQLSEKERRARLMPTRYVPKQSPVATKAHPILSYLSAIVARMPKGVLPALSSELLRQQRLVKEGKQTLAQTAASHPRVTPLINVMEAMAIQLEELGFKVLRTPDNEDLADIRTPLTAPLQAVIHVMIDPGTKFNIPNVHIGVRYKAPTDISKDPFQGKQTQQKLADIAEYIQGTIHFLTGNSPKVYIHTFRIEPSAIELVQTGAAERGWRFRQESLSSTPESDPNPPPTPVDRQNPSLSDLPITDVQQDPPKADAVTAKIEEIINDPADTEPLIDVQQDQPTMDVTTTKIEKILTNHPDAKPLVDVLKVWNEPGPQILRLLESALDLQAKFKPARNVRTKKATFYTDSFVYPWLTTYADRGIGIPALLKAINKTVENKRTELGLLNNYPEEEPSALIQFLQEEAKTREQAFIRFPLLFTGLIGILLLGWVPGLALWHSIGILSDSLQVWTTGNILVPIYQQAHPTGGFWLATLVGALLAVSPKETTTPSDLSTASSFKDLQKLAENPATVFRLSEQARDAQWRTSPARRALSEKNITDIVETQVATLRRIFPFATKDPAQIILLRTRLLQFWSLNNRSLKGVEGIKDWLERLEKESVSFRMDQLATASSENAVMALIKTWPKEELQTQPLADAIQTRITELKDEALLLLQSSLEKTLDRANSLDALATLYHTFTDQHGNSPRFKEIYHYHLVLLTRFKEQLEAANTFEDIDEILKSFPKRPLLVNPLFETALTFHLNRIADRAEGRQGYIFMPFTMLLALPFIPIFDTPIRLIIFGGVALLLRAIEFISANPESSANTRTKLKRAA